ncbi:MAG TPA: alpha-glycosidase, partial [Weissella confusa]|nr:alpha-glycosidase [Weissella confusa]
DELPDDFIAGIRDQMSKEQVLIGEVWEDASNKVAYDQRRQYLLGGGLQATMHYPLRNLILDFMLEEIDARVFTTVLMTLESNYPKNAFFGAFPNMGTHDTKRLFTEMGEDEEKLKRALELWLTMPGVPCVYYGDEMGMTG